MDNEKKILGKKRQNDKIIIEKLIDDSQNINPKQPENNIIKPNSNIISSPQENLNLNLNTIKNNALSFGELNTPTAFTNKIEPSVPLNLTNNNSILTFGKNSSYPPSKSPEQMDYQVPIPNPQLNPQSISNKKSMLVKEKNKILEKYGPIKKEFDVKNEILFKKCDIIDKYKTEFDK